MKRDLPVALALVDTATTIVATTIAYGIAAHAIDHGLLGLWVTVTAGFTLTQVVDFAGAPLTSLLAEARSQRRSEDVSGYLIASTSLNTVVSAVLVSICGLIMTAIAGVIESNRYAIFREVVMYQGPALWLRGLGNVAQSAFLGLGQPIGKVILSVAASGLLLVGVCILVPKYGLQGLLLAQVLVGFAVGCGAVVGVVGVARASGVAWHAPERVHFREIARAGTQMMGVNVIVALQDPAAKGVIGWIMGAQAIFLYDAAGRLIQLLRIPATFIGPFAVPHLAMAKGTGRKLDLLVTWHRYGKAVTGLMFSACAAFSAFVAKYWLNVKGQEFVEIFVPLAIGWYVHVSAVPFHFGLLAERSFRTLIRSQGIRVMCSVCGGGLLGGFWGSRGAILGIVVGLLAETWYLWRSVEQPERRSRRGGGFWSRECASVAPVIAGGVFGCGYVYMSGAGPSLSAQAAYLLTALLGLVVAWHLNGTLAGLLELVRLTWTRWFPEGTQ